MAIYIRRITWIDANGASRTTQVFGNATVATVQVALQNGSNADYIIESEAQVFANASPTPVSATYATVDDFAELWLQTSANTILTLTVPAPKSSMFLADQETVDPAGAFVTGLMAVATGLVCDLAGNTVTNFVGGIRRFTGRLT